MSRYTEILPARKSSKHSCCHWSPAEADYSPTAGRLTIDTDRARAEYVVTEFPTGWRGRGFTLEKLGSPGRYDVFCSADGPAADSCDCPGATYHPAGHCKHKDAIRALVGNGWL